MLYAVYLPLAPDIISYQVTTTGNEQCFPISISWSQNIIGKQKEIGHQVASKTRSDFVNFRDVLGPWSPRPSRRAAAMLIEQECDDKAGRRALLWVIVALRPAWSE